MDISCFPYSEISDVNAIRDAGSSGSGNKCEKCHLCLPHGRFYLTLVPLFVAPVINLEIGGTNFPLI